jgi:hypothetical protein
MCKEEEWEAMGKEALASQILIIYKKIFLSSLKLMHDRFFNLNRNQCILVLFFYFLLI